jgi:cell division protein FtsB
MKVNLGIWNALTWVAILLGFVAGLMLLVEWYFPLIKQNERMRKEILALSTQIKKEEKTRDELKSSIDALKHDPKTIERQAREQLRYAKPGETVIRFDEPAAGSSTTN